MEHEIKPQTPWEKEILDRYKKLSGKKTWWIRIPKKWWFNDLESLAFSERCVLISLKLHANQKGECFPSLRTMARQLNANPKTILRAVKNLEKKQYIKVVVRKGRFNSYLLNGHSC